MTSLSVLSVALLVSTGVQPAAPRPQYVARIPNGDRVTSSMALGHVNANGTGALNAFGRRFIFSARTWDVDLCTVDSDGDGQTNGQELGDPCCEWVPGDIPRFTDGVSHPGKASETSNDSRWINLTCPNVTKLSIMSGSAKSGCSVVVMLAAVLLGLRFSLRN